MKKKTNNFIKKWDGKSYLDKDGVRNSMKTAFHQDDREEFKKYIKILAKK